MILASRPFTHQLDLVFGQLPLVRVADVPEPFGLPKGVLLVVAGGCHRRLVSVAELVQASA
ncbi:MAG: hypothetical protein ACRECZ_07930 [Methylocella sp.]